MKKIVKSRYAILRELTDAALEEAVTAYMNDGWKPVGCLLYTSPSPRDISGSRMPSSA